MSEVFANLGWARPGRAYGRAYLGKFRLSSEGRRGTDERIHRLSDFRIVSTSNRTETDHDLPRATARTPLLKQVLPLPDGFSLASGADLPAWVVDRELLIGRSADSEKGIRLDKDRKVSSEHSLLRPHGSAVEITDLGSKNSTFVNGRPVKTAVLLDGAVLRVGNTLFVLRLERARTDDAPQAERGLHERLLGRSQEMRELRRGLSQAARSIDSALLIGPTGTGKELGAGAVHALSLRREGPFIPVNCASIPPSTAESMLFGHRRGAFTGADRDHDGFFKQADTGTLFLDEIGEMSLDCQAKLLRALEPASQSMRRLPGKNLLHIHPLGSQSQVPVDTRILAATNVDLEQAVAAGRFRGDLYQRLCVLPVRFPPLAQRREDILPILHYYLNQDRKGAAPYRVSARLGELMLLCRWPGNVRELAHVSRRLVNLAPRTELIDLDLVPDDLLVQLSNIEEETEKEALQEGAPQSQKRERVTYELLTRLLQENNWVKSKVARILNRSPKEIRRRMDEMGIPRFPASEGRSQSGAGPQDPQTEDEGGEPT